MTYTFRTGGSSFGWANVTINDVTGDLSIASDWGDWSHSWYIPHTGCKSLTEFIAGVTHSGYLADKLSGRPNKFDPDGTGKAFKEIIIERRREKNGLSKELARELWEEIESLCDNWNSSDGFIAAYFGSYLCDELTKHICEEPWEHVRCMHESNYRALIDIILPAVIDICKKVKMNQEFDTLGLFTRSEMP